MADGDLLVTISGAALSLLFYENVRSPGDQMGFLLGETLKFVVKTYTDSDNQVETVKIHNNIQTVVTCPLPDLLHDSTGRINKEKLKDFVRDKSKQVIGWFRFRRNTNLVPTLRDKILHKEFASHFSGGNGSKEEFFVTCILSFSMSETRGTHKFKHVFLRRKRGTFEPIPLKINNLGMDSFRHDGSDYKLTPPKKLSDIPDVFSNLIDSLNLDLTRLGGLESAITIQKTAEQYLDQLIDEVCESDLEVAELEKQVRELRTSIVARKLSKKTNFNGTAETIDETYEAQKDSTSEEEQTSEKISPSRIEVVENICNDGHLSKELTTSTSQTISTPKRRTATAVVNQEKSKKLGLSPDIHNNPNQDTFVNTAPETKKEVLEGVTTRSRCLVSTFAEITKESSESGSVNTRVKSVHDYNPGMKKARRSTGSVTARSERSSYTHLSEPESTEASSFRNTSPVRISKRRVDNARSATDTTDTH